MSENNIMESHTKLNGMSDNELEEWFLANVQNTSLSCDQLLTVVNKFKLSDQTDKANVCADLLQECLAERGAEDDLLSLLELRASWHGNDEAFRSTCEKWLCSYSHKKLSISKFIHHLGFDKNITAKECLRRLQVLRKLKPGVLCYNKTQGFGKVAEVDDYAQQIVFDFEKLKQHRMSFNYAGETVQLLSDDHILVKHYRDPQGFNTWLEQKPAEVIKSVILSFGPMSIPHIQNIMTESMIQPDKWKSFWESARKALKDDPYVSLPPKRNEPIRLLENGLMSDDQWISSIKKEKDFDRIFIQINKLKRSRETPALSDSLKNSAKDRLTYVIHGAGKKQWGITAHALVLADELDIHYPSEELDKIYMNLFQPDTLLHVIQKLPSRIIPDFLRLLFKQDDLRSVELLIEIMPNLTITFLNAVIAFLLKTGHETRVVEYLRSSVVLGHPSRSIIYWLCRHLEFSAKNKICTSDALAVMALNNLDTGQLPGEPIKMLNLLRALFEKDDWLKTVVESMNNVLRRDFTIRLKHSPAWQEGDRITLLSRLIQFFPELRKALEDTKPSVSMVKRVTSWRSYSERQARLLKIINEDIPRNSRDIGTARSYGDLRENYEYKAAREMQAILMKRRIDLDRMLSNVEPTNFDNISTDKAGMGTRVTIQRDDGAKEQYVILGEWDHDDKLGIISLKSKLAEALEGHKTGEHIPIPSEIGPTFCTIAEISSLPDEIKAWCRNAK